MQLSQSSRVITDSEYYTMSHQSYRDLRINEKVKDEITGKWWVVVDTMNEENGAQGAAFVSVDKRGVRDNSQVVIAYRGTLPTQWDGDITADILQVGLNIPFIPKTKDMLFSNIPTLSGRTQFKSALDFSDRVSDIPEYKRAKFTYTGHSLGGGEAHYTAAERGREAVTFAAPNIYGLLSNEAKQRVDAGEMREMIIDYVHENDILGSFSNNDPLIGKQHYTMPNNNALTSWGNPIAGHGINTFTSMFQGDGSIQFRMEPEAMVKTIQSFRPRLELIRDWRTTLERYIEDEPQAVREIYYDMLSNVEGSGKYPLLSQHDVTSHFKKRAWDVRGSDFFFIDVDLVTDMIRKLHKFEQKMEKLLDDLTEAAKTTQALDKDVSLWFGGKQ